MTLLTSPAAGQLTWASPAPSIWVATSSDEFLGMIEQTELGFRTTDGTGTYLGFSETLEEAQLRLTDVKQDASTSRLELLQMKAMLALALTVTATAGIAIAVISR